ncbi:MAG: hypothetical protein FJ125_04885, partial [Deltaproteobacteria bacterium]|nr:hypothetical protein [Deltaproteobacteria bacterium]
MVADLLVAETSTLTIEAGATVQLGAGVGIEVRGALVARGTKERPIRFTLLDGAAGSGDGQPGEPVTWGSLTFADSARDAVLDDEGGYLSGSILEHCLFEQGSRAVWLLGASPAIIDSSFLANRIGVTPELKCGAALFVGPGSAPLIRGNKFADNEAGGFCQGGAVFVDLGQPILQDNRFLRNASAYGGALATNGLYSPIVGNLFESNRVLTKGGALSLISSSPAFLDNTVRA